MTCLKAGRHKLSSLGVEKPYCVILFASGWPGVVLETRTHKCFLDIVTSCRDRSIDEAFEVKHREPYLNVIHTIIP